MVFQNDRYRTQQELLLQGILPHSVPTFFQPIFQNVLTLHETHAFPAFASQPMLANTAHHFSTTLHKYHYWYWYQ